MKNIPYHFINACEECSLVMETPIQMTSCSLQLAGGMLQVKQAVLSLADRRNSLSCGWLTRRKESMVRSESQSTFVRISWMVGRSISQVFAKGGRGGVEGGAAVSMCCLLSSNLCCCGDELASIPDSLKLLRNRDLRKFSIFVGYQNVHL